jgi:hypothetical protein
LNKTPLLIALLTLLFSTTGLAQQTTGNLEGIVLGETGEPIPYAQVVATGPSLQGQRSVVVSSDGYFQLIGLPVGLYDVEISLIGYRKVVLEDALVHLSKTTSLGEVRLVVQAIEMPAMVITAEKPMIDPTSTVLGFNFDAEDYRSLPIDRDYRHVASLTPEANESYLGDEVNFFGSTGSENKYFIDGVEVTDPYRGLTGMMLPYNFVKETQVRAGAYEAEYRSSLGGIMNVVTQSGGDEFHGQVFGFLVNDRLSGEALRASWEPSSGDFANYDIGFSLGGPVFRDKLWFFGAYDPSIVKEDVEIPGLGFYEDHQTAHKFAGKLTWRPSNRSNLVFTILGDPIVRRGIGASLTAATFIPTSFENPDPYLSDIESSGYSMSLEGKHFVNEAFFIDVLVSRLNSKYRNQPATERGRNEMRFIDVDTGVWSGGAYSMLDNLNVVNTVGASGTVLLGNHNIKTGLEYKENRLDFDETWHGLYRFSDSLFYKEEYIYDRAVANRIPSAFVQDSWRVGRRLRINGGLRWDGQFLIGTDGNVAQKILDQWQPRIGFVFQPGEIGKSKIYSSYGRFYQELSTSILVNYYVEGGSNHLIEYDHDPRINPAGGDTTFFAGMQSEIDMEGEYYDEFSLGYEREIVSGSRIGVRGIYRTLGQAIEDGIDLEAGIYVLGNPGRGPLSDFPEARREHKSLEFYYQKSGGDRFHFLTSYALSRTYGNYSGLFDTDWLSPWPNFTYAFNFVETMENSTGLLPHDRTHVFKFSGSYLVGYGLTTGVSFFWMSGAPKTEWGGSTLGEPWIKIIDGRGKAGRMPSLWDLNLRFSYDMQSIGISGLQPRFIMDLYHVGNPRRTVKNDETHYNSLDEDGNQADPNPNYDRPFLFQPPMAMRLGIELNF